MQNLINMYKKFFLKTLCIPYFPYLRSSFEFWLSKQSDYNEYAEKYFE